MKEKKYGSDAVLSRKIQRQGPRNEVLLLYAAMTGEHDTKNRSGIFQACLKACRWIPYGPLHRD